jgi:membrane associated rhomboid family serine protease
LLADPLAPEQLVTLVTSAFLHAGWVHLAGNLLYLIVFGPIVESRLGALRFSLLFVASGMVGAVAHVMAGPESSVPMVGASGAIAGVLGAHVVLEPRSRITTVVPVIVFVEVAVLPAAFVIALWFVLQLASALAPVAPQATEGQVAWFAHLGGFVTGAVLSRIAAAGRKGTRGQGGKRAGGPKSGGVRRAA